MKDIDDAIARYRDELTAEAALAEPDLAEIEDHMRTLIDELRETMSLADAIRAARDRFGEPGAVAREHAQVRTPFGARLSRARAWSAAALLLPFEVLLVWGFLSMSHGRASMFAGPIVQGVLGIGVIVALAARQTWARAFVYGVTPLSIIWIGFTALFLRSETYFVVRMIAEIGALLIVMPWRRGELTRAGLGLALMAPVYAMCGAMLWIYPPDHSDPLASVLGVTIMAVMLTAAAGAMLRARWAAPMTLATGVLLAYAAVRAGMPQSFPPYAGARAGLMIASEVIAVVFAAAAAAIQWRDATSRFGTLRSVR